MAGAGVGAGAAVASASGVKPVQPTARSLLWSPEGKHNGNHDTTGGAGAGVNEPLPTPSPNSSGSGSGRTDGSPASQVLTPKNAPSPNRPPAPDLIPTPTGAVEGGDGDADDRGDDGADPACGGDGGKAFAKKVKTRPDDLVLRRKTNELNGKENASAASDEGQQAQGAGLRPTPPASRDSKKEVSLNAKKRRQGSSNDLKSPTE